MSSGIKTEIQTNLPMLVTVDKEGNIEKLEVISKHLELFHKLESARKENSKLAKRIGSQRRKITGVRDRKNEAERLLRKLVDQDFTPENYGTIVNAAREFLAYKDKRETVETK